MHIVYKFELWTDMYQFLRTRSGTNSQSTSMNHKNSITSLPDLEASPNYFPVRLNIIKCYTLLNPH